MIAWAAEVAKASELFERIGVTTDDDKVAKLAEDWRVVDIDNEDDWIQAELIFRDLFGSVD